MLNRPAESQDLSDGLEVKAARRKWNPALHPRDSKGRFIETGGTVRLWGGKLARVVRALPNDRILVQDQTTPGEFTGRRHTTSAKWVSMVARPDGSAPTEDEDKVVAEDEKRIQDPRRGNGVARDDDGDPSTPNDPHDSDDQGRPIGDDEDGDGPDDDDDQDEPADGRHPVNTAALPNRQHAAGARFTDTAAVRQHFAQLADRPGQNPDMSKFLRSVADDDDLQTTSSGRLVILRDDETDRWYLSSAGTGQRMGLAGDFDSPQEAAQFADRLEATTRTDGPNGAPFDFSDPDADKTAGSWKSSKGENIPAAIKRVRQEFEAARPAPAASPTDSNAAATVSRGDLKPGDHIKVTVASSDVEWPSTTRDQDKPKTVTVEGTLASTYDESRWAPLLDATLTTPDGTIMTSVDSVRLRSMPGQVAVSGHADDYVPEPVRADRVRVGDVVAGGEFGHVITDVNRYPEGRTFTTRHLGGRREVHQFGADTGDMMNIIPRARRRPEDVHRSTNRMEQHPNSADAKRAAAAVLKDWAAANELTDKQWPDGAPEAFRALVQHLQNVTDEPKGAEGYRRNSQAMRGALAAIDELDTDGLDRGTLRALHRLEERLDENADRFEADSRAITENKKRREAEANNPNDAGEQSSGSVPAGGPESYDPSFREETDENASITYYRTPQGVSRDVGGRFGVGEPVRTPQGETFIVVSGNDDGTVNGRKEPLNSDAPLGRSETFPADDLRSLDGFRPWRLDAEPAAADDGTPSPDDPEVRLRPDEVNAPAAAARAAKAPSAMNDPEIRDEIVSLLEAEMANGGELSGVDRTRLRVLEAEEARRAGRKPKEDPKPKAKPVAEPDGMFDVGGQEEEQRQAADFNNPDDQPADATGTPDMFAAAEGRDTSNLRPPQMRAPIDLQQGDRFVDADRRTHTVAQEPVRTGRGRVLVVTEDGRQHFLAPDTEMRVLYPDETAPEVPKTNGPDGNTTSTDTPEGDDPAPNVPEGETTSAADEETAAPEETPAAASDQIVIDHSGTGTTVRFPTPNGMVSDTEFEALQRMGFKPSRNRTQPRFFYLQSNTTLSRRTEKVRQLKKWLDEQNVAYQEPTESNAEKPELTEEQLEQIKDQHFAPAGTWAVTDFQPGDEVWTGRQWDTVDSLGPKNLRLQSRGSMAYNRVLARRRGDQIRTMFDAPEDDGTPRPGTTDPKRMHDERIAEELAQLRGAALPEGNDPSARAVRRQVSARIQALTDRQAELEWERRRNESERRSQSLLVRQPERLAARKAEQVQGRDGTPLGIVYPEKKGKWRIVDRDGRLPSTETYPTRAAAITALHRITNIRNDRAGEGWKHSAWDDVQAGDTIRVPELGRTESTGRIIVAGWSEPLAVSEISRGDLGQVRLSGRRGDEDVTLEIGRAHASYGTSKPGTVPDRERSDAGGGMPWQQMRPEDFGQDETPAPAADSDTPRPTDEFGTPDLIANGQTDDTDASDHATAPDPPIRDTSPADMTDDDISAELEELQAWQARHVTSTGEGPRVRGNLMLALSPVGNRRGRLWEEQRKREATRQDRERREKEKQERAAALARAEIGKRNGDGSYPVTVDGEDAGTVRQLARQWQFTDDNGNGSPDFHKSRADAVTALVRLRDNRQQQAADADRQEQARSKAPEGWVLGDRADVAENDIIRMPRNRRGRDGRPYPEGWGQPARVNSVERRDDGSAIVSYSSLDGSHTWGSPLFLDGPDDTFAWASDRTRPEPTPKWHHEIRARMADIGDDIATLQNRDGLQDPERIQRLQDLIQRVSRAETDDLQGDLRQIRDEAAWIESQFDDPDLELPYETRSTRSWATAARMKAERDLRYSDFQQGSIEEPSTTAPEPERDGRSSRAQDLFGEGMNAVGGDSLPEMQELNDRLDRVDSAEDRGAELRDIADRMDALAEQYDLAGPQGELAANRFRRAARVARGEQDVRDERRGDDEGQADDSNSPDGESDDNQDDTTSTQEGEDGDGGAPDPEGGPDGGGAGTPEAPGDGRGSRGNDDGPGNGSDDEQDRPDEEDNEDQRERRRRRNRGGGNGGGGPGGPGLPHLRVPELDAPDTTGGSGDNGTGGNGGVGDSGRGRTSRRHPDIESLRNAWKTGEGLTPAEDTPERRALLAEAANREGLTLSPEGGLVMWPEPQVDGIPLWRFAQARNGTNLPGITLSASDPEEVRALAARFEEITNANGDPFDWNRPWGPSSIAQWRDGEGRNLPGALNAVRDDYERERAGGFTLPEDLTTLSSEELDAAFSQGLGPEDQLRVMAEMDRRDNFVDARVRAAAPETPPANAEETESRSRAMDEALNQGGATVTQPTPATPGNLRREFDALDEERYQAALQVTGGRMLSPEAEAEGVDPRDLFSHRKFTNKRAEELASDELREWWNSNGRMTYAAYRQRETDRVLQAEFADIDEARYLAAIEATNGYFVDRRYKYDDTVDERTVFSGGNLSSRDRWREYASEELQEWFDANGGRLTFNQYKEQRRTAARVDLQEHEERQRRAAETGEPVDSGTFTAANVTPPPPFNALQVESEEDAAFRFGGRGQMQAFARQAEVRPSGMGDSEFVWFNGQQIGAITNLRQSNSDQSPVWDAHPFFGLSVNLHSRSRSRDTAVANLVVRALQDGLADPANPSDDVWDTVTANLASIQEELPELPQVLRNAPEASARYERLKGMVDAFRDQRSPSGDLRQDLVQARDDFAWLRQALDGPKRNQKQRDEMSELDRRSFWADRILDAFGDPDNDVERPRGDDEEQTTNIPPSPEPPAPDQPVNTPEDTPRPPAESAPDPEPEPIGGQPAHWARVEDLVPGDMVRMDGTTKKGKPIQRAGYVYTPPVRVEVTRRGRTQYEWRTWVTENSDGTGAAGNVYTSAKATAARAEAPDDVAPGSPVSGAQASLRSGDLPNQIPADRHGRGLFPGSTVTGPNDREGTVTGATDTTAAVRWSNGDDTPSLSPTTLTVTDSQRPDGWTPSGQRVTTQHIVSDTDGALLGPVDTIEGDNVTVITADGSITRSAGDLRITGEVRDDVPAVAPVAALDEPAAADLKDGDVVLLDLDGKLATVAITSPPDRDGDRVTLQYADTTTGEIGEINVDARAILPRAQGADGGAPNLGADDAPEPDDDLVVHPAPHVVDPVTGPTIDPGLTMGDRTVIDDQADGPDDNPDAHQAAVRITSDLPVTPEQAIALASQLRAAADPSTSEGRAALRAADHLDRAAGRNPPAGLDRPRPSNAAQVSDGDLIAMPDERHSDQLRTFRVIDAEDGPGGVRSFLLEDENQQWRRRLVHGAMPVWQLPEAEPDPVTPPDADDTTPDTPTPSAPSAPDEPTAPVARIRPGGLRIGDVIDAPVSRTGYQLNGHHRLTLISEPQHSGWWMQLTGIDEDGNVHDFGLHNGRAVNVYDRNRPTPALPPVGTPRDPNQTSQPDIDRMVSDHARTLAARIIDEAIAGTEPPADIHALREQIAEHLTDDALSNARQTTRNDGLAALDAAGITGRDRGAARRRLRETRERAHAETVRAALRTVNDLEPLPGESNEELAARARDLLRLIPNQVATRPPPAAPGADPAVNRTVTGHAGDAVKALLRQLRAAGVDPGDAERITRILTQQMAGSRQATARRIAARVAAASPDAGRQPGLLARIVALLIRMAKRLSELVKAGAQNIAEKYQGARERLARLRAFLGRMVRRVRQWPEARRLARLHRAVNLPDADGQTLAARISHWAGLMPEPGRFGQAQRRVTLWRPTTWGQLAAGHLPDRSDRVQWTPDRAADGGPGLTALRHMAALRAAGRDVDQDVTSRLSAALGDDFGDDPHATLQDADDYVATSERRLVSLQAARSGATIPDDPDLEVEIDAARTELSTARRQYADLRNRYAAAVPDAVAAALADIRDMGPEGSSALVFSPDTDPDAERAVRGVQRLIPRAWLNTAVARRVTAVNGAQGGYEPQGQRITVADLADEGMGTAGYALAQHLARHFGDLDAAQRAFFFTSTHTGRPGARRMQLSALDRLLRRQQTQPETGDSLARSIQAMFSGDWYQDDDLRAFLMGLMATR
ncbi:hypothetical protein AB0H92_11065 [Streptomyces phaeochromogenes]|uniref:hypothetical protein n=1 Tax=Streptomyces phaeochromogenes TaxID=1923 RepID=UPI0033C871F0